MRRAAATADRLSEAFARVETERLLLRRPVHLDLDELHRIHSDSRTWEHKPEGRNGRAHSGRRLAHWLAHWESRGYGYWTVELHGRIVGFGGLMLLPRWRGRRGDALNLYYRLDPPAWGRGYASELALVAVELAGRELPELPVVARIRDGNERSVRVAERIGLLRRPDLDDAEYLVYASV
jgi:ribosomal-protein-alanine N-acetyltransferase